MLVEKSLAVQAGASTQWTHHAMGTVMAHQVFGPYAEASLDAVEAEIARIEGLLSRFIPTSDISRVNHSAGMGSQKVSRETYDVLEKAVEFSRAYPGCFDVTVEPLIDLWHAARENLSPPDEVSLQQNLALVDERDLILDPWEMTAGLRYPGQALDLGGIGKGYTADRVREVFQRFGVSSACSNMGGNVMAVGTKPDGSPWRVGIQHPRQEGRILGSVAVVDQTVVTSGDYQRFFTDRQGRRWHHILNPRSGYPAQSGLVSVTIITGKSVEADALSTVVFVAGMEKGLRVLKRFPQAEAVLVDAGMRVYVTAGLRHRFFANKDVDVTILN